MAKLSVIAKENSRCIFCQGGATAGNKMSREHLWSEWMTREKLLPEIPDPEYVETQRSFRRRTGETKEHSRSRQGAPATKKIGAVCAACNNVWMSQLETSAAPWLRPLITGNAVVLDPIGRTVLAKWIAMKLFVVEHNRIERRSSDPIFQQVHRTAFMGQNSIPRGLKIWLACQTGEKWGASYHRHVCGLTVSHEKPKSQSAEDEPKEKNVQDVTWGIGRLLIHLQATTDISVFENIDLEPSKGLVPLWPLTGNNIQWPPEVTLSDQEIDRLTGLLERLLSSNTVVRPWDPVKG